ncbi:MAG: AMP-binding protein, partial [Candidatus Hydrogenedentes bacterium]|nr:AMP-binding protein [Candidatus Hydrogenedentota bacterium]
MCREVLKSIRACPVAVRAQKSPESIAFIAAGKSFSYHDFHLEISACQVRLQSQGIRAGDRVLLSDLCPLDSCIMLWTLFRMGAVACPVNPLLPRKNLDAVMAVLEPQWVCHPAESAAACPVFQRLECFDEEGTERGSTFFFTAGRDAAVVMTSGSSGTPRLAIHSFENYMQGAIAANRNMPVVPGDRWLLSLPLFHVAGLAVLFRCALAGAAVVVPEADMSFEEALIQSCATQVSLVPTQLYRLLKSATSTEMLRSM